MSSSIPPADPADPTSAQPVRQRSLWLKGFAIGFVVFLLAVASALVFGVVAERHQRAREVEWELAATWGPQQAVGAPMLYLLQTPATADGVAPPVPALPRSPTRHRLLPRELHWQATVEPQVRRRGLYPVLLYRARLHGTGTFDVPPAPGRTWTPQGVELSFGNLEGIQSASIVVGGAATPFERQPVDAQRSILWTELDVPIADHTGGVRVPFEVEIELHGSRGLSWLPLASEITIDLRSSWPSPSFGGVRLPDEHRVDADGFTATWRTGSLQRAAAELAVAAPGSLPDLTGTAFGVDLILTASPYQRVERAVKYALLLVALVFTAVFVLETMGSRWLHPVHYAFVGADLCLFFLLLLALAEHLGFRVAYAAAAVATAGSVALYARAILGSAGAATALLAVLAGLFGFIFVLLSAETYALLLGAAGLFVLLVTAMYATRRLDWYDLRPRATRSVR